VKYTFLLFFAITSLAAFGQKVSGVVIDKASRQVMPGVVVSAANKTTRTNQAGQFEIDVLNSTDSLKISAIGYKILLVAHGKSNTFLTIELESKVTSLNEVTIYGSKSFKKDSLANRDEYGKQFNYTPPKLKDVIGLPTSDRPGQLLSIDVLALVRYLTYKSSPDYKFKQVLIRDEHEQFVDEKFNRGNVSRITKMQGDTLLSFLAKYRPTYEFVLKSTDYDMEVYIKDCHKKFEQEGFAMKGPFVKQD
jgi:hypothetical protein